MRHVVLHRRSAGAIPGCLGAPRSATQRLVDATPEPRRRAADREEARKESQVGKSLGRTALEFSLARRSVAPAVLPESKAHLCEVRIPWKSKVHEHTRPLGQAARPVDGVARPVQLPEARTGQGSQIVAAQLATVVGQMVKRAQQCLHRILRAQCLCAAAERQACASQTAGRPRLRLDVTPPLCLRQRRLED
jgi:hypothetical protein